ncbi:MAG: hypothetical protein ABJC88_17005 [Parasphingorhabdus sp.]|uniref:hypothetical protein n=1 Tax=Sphingomonadales TaxID=204457 RepID=UPI003263100F
MTCEELQAQYDAQVAAGDQAGADATFQQMIAQGCNNSSGGGGNGPFEPPGGLD